MRETRASHRPTVLGHAVGACGLAVLCLLLGCAETGPSNVPERPNKESAPAAPGPPPAAAPTSQAAALREETLDAAQRLAEQFPDDPESVYMLAMVYDQHGEGPKAEECWKKCLKLDSRFVRAQYCLAQTALERGDYQQGVNWLRAALEVDPRLSEAHLLLGQAMMGQGRLEEALAPLDRHVLLSPQSIDGHFALGQVYLQLGRYEKAKQHHQTVLRIDPDWWNAYGAYYGLAAACRKLGQEEQAEQYLEEFRHLKSQSEQLLKGLYRDYDDADAMRASAARLLRGMSVVHAQHENRVEAQRLRSRAAELDLAGQESPAIPRSEYGR